MRDKAKMRWAEPIAVSFLPLWRQVGVIDPADPLHRLSVSRLILLLSSQSPVWVCVGVTSCALLIGMISRGYYLGLPRSFFPM
jgi:hypothetical protein